MRARNDYDAMIFGAGSLGLNAAYKLARRGQRVLVIEREQGIGRLSTNQNARLWSGLYASTSEIAILTMGSLPFLDDPGSRFFSRPVTKKIDVLYLAGSKDPILEMERILSQASKSPYRNWTELDVTKTDRLIPQIPSDLRELGIHEIGRRLDVYSLLDGLTKGIEDAEGRVLDRTDTLVVDKTASGEWRITTTNGTFIAPVVINAAGAKGDLVAKSFEISPVGLQVTKRHRIIGHVNEPDRLPSDERFIFLPDLYFASEGHGMLMFSGADETNCDPTDMVPDPRETKRILGLMNKYMNVTLREENIQVTAGHRPFVPDRNPVIGPEPGRRDYYTLLAPGGYGMQAGPAMARILETLIMNDPIPEEFEAQGLRLEAFSVGRLRAKANETVKAEV